MGNNPLLPGESEVDRTLEWDRDGIELTSEWERLCGTVRDLASIDTL